VGVLGVHGAALALGLSLGAQLEVSLPPSTGTVLQVRLLPVSRSAPARGVSAAPSVAPRTPPKTPSFPDALSGLTPLTPTRAMAAAPPARPAVPVSALAREAPMAGRPPSNPVLSSLSTTAPTAAALAAVSAAAPASAPLRLTRGPVALPGNPMPAYPLAAREDGLEGPVDLRVDVSAQGQVRQVDWARRSGILLLDLAARDAVRQWRFQPALQDGEPVAGSLHVVIRFRLDAPVTLVALSDTGSR
jgi:periplasmic protein TonB